MSTETVSTIHRRSTARTEIEFHSAALPVPRDVRVGARVRGSYAGTRLARCAGMALWRADATTSVIGGPSPALAAALCSAELGEPQPTQRMPIDALRELFQSAALLRASVPFATVQLLAQLAGDGRVEVRAGVAE